jgi:nucleoside-diphosphate-sugar epimerase
VANAVPEFSVVATSRTKTPADAGLHTVMARLDRAISINTTSGAMARSIPRPGRERAMTKEGGRTAPIARDTTLVHFDAAEPAIAAATHILVTASPDADGDPALNRYATVIAAAPALRWIGYLSSTVVYGDRNGAWVDEDTSPAPAQPRGQWRLNAEFAWSRFADRYAVDIFRLAGIYGPGRSAFDDLRAGTARRMRKQGHQFGRIHRDDIGRAVAAAMRQVRAPGCRVLNLTDDVPSESAAVVTEAARLMGVPPPPETELADAFVAMSPMARSFWTENRKVSSQKTQQALGLRWLYPSFREGLAAIWREENGDRPL